MGARSSSGRSHRQRWHPEARSSRRRSLAPVDACTHPSARSFRRRSHPSALHSWALAPVGARSRRRSHPEAGSSRGRSHPSTLAPGGAVSATLAPGGALHPSVLAPVNARTRRRRLGLRCFQLRVCALMKSHSDEMSSHSPVLWIQDPFSECVVGSVRQIQISRFRHHFPLPFPSRTFPTQTRSTGTRGRFWVRARMPRSVKNIKKGLVTDRLTDTFSSLSSLGDLDSRLQ